MQVAVLTLFILIGALTFAGVIINMTWKDKKPD